MLPAEFAVLVHFESVRVIFLVFHGVIISLFAFGTCQGNFNSHFLHPLYLVEKCIGNYAVLRHITHA